MATARAFAESGAAVMLADLDADALDQAVGELTGAGHRAAERCATSPTRTRSPPP